MQIIQNSKFIIIKTNPIQTSPFTNYIGYKAHKYHKSTKKSHSHFVISNNIFIFAPESVDITANQEERGFEFGGNKNPWR